MCTSDTSSAEMLKFNSSDYHSNICYQIWNPANRSWSGRWHSWWAVSLPCAVLEQRPKGRNATGSTSVTALAFIRSHTGHFHTCLGHCSLFAHCALVLTVGNHELYRCLSCGSSLFPFFSTTKTHFLLSPSFCHADQLRDSMFYLYRVYRYRSFRLSLSRRQDFTRRSKKSLQKRSFR